MKQWSWCKKNHARLLLPRGCAVLLAASMVFLSAGVSHPAYAAESEEPDFTETAGDLFAAETDLVTTEQSTDSFDSPDIAVDQNSFDIIHEESADLSVSEEEIILRGSNSKPSLEVSAMDETAEVLYDGYEVIFGASGTLQFDQSVLDEEFEYLAEWDEELQNADVSLTFTSIKPEVISITEDGAYQANKVGQTKIKVTADYTLTFATWPEVDPWPEDEEDPGEPDPEEPELRTVTGSNTYIYRMFCIPDMTNVKFAVSSQNLFFADNNYVNDGAVKIKLINDGNGTYKFTDGNTYTSIYLESYKYYDPYLYYNLEKDVLTIHTYKAGHNILVFRLNGKKLTLKLHSYKLSMTPSVLLLKGSSKSLTVKGLPADTKVTWSIGSKTVGSITSAGKVTGNAAGATYVTAKVGNVKLATVLNVAAAAQFKAIRNGKQIAQGTYSQSKRMQTGYYDCSSLVWRSYSPYGYYFGSKNWAPTAAADAQFLAKKKKIFLDEGEYTYERINSLKAGRAGDVVFLTGYNNGRYLGIYHIEMMCGYTFTGYDWNGKPTAMMTYASKSDGAYDGWNDCIVGRPVKG